MFRLLSKSQNQVECEKPKQVGEENGVLPNFRKRASNIILITTFMCHLIACSAQGNPSNATDILGQPHISHPTVTTYGNVTLSSEAYSRFALSGARPDIVFAALDDFNNEVGCPALKAPDGQLIVEVSDDPNTLAQTFSERSVIELNPVMLRSEFEKHATAKYGPLSKDKMDELFNDFLQKVLIHEFGHFCFVNYNGDNNQSLEFVIRQADGSVLVLRQVRGFGFELLVENGSIKEREFNPILSEALAEYFVERVTGETNEFSDESYRNLAGFMKLIIDELHWLDLNDIVAKWNDPNINFRIISLIVGKHDVNDLTLSDFLTVIKVLNEVAEGRVSKENGLYIINQLRNKNMQQ